MNDVHNKVSLFSEQGDKMGPQTHSDAKTCKRSMHLLYYQCFIKLINQSVFVLHQFRENILTKAG